MSILINNVDITTDCRSLVDYLNMTSVILLNELTLIKMKKNVFQIYFYDMNLLIYLFLGHAFLQNRVLTL